jgi:Uma2 family endonuclease
MARMAIESGVTTAEELIKLPSGQWRYELVDGVLRRMTPAGQTHGRAAARIGARLTAFVDEHKLGATYAAETGFLLRRSPDTVRAPDASFVTNARLATLELSPRGYFPGAPNLAVEVLSPDDSHSEVEEKAADWLASGCEVVVLLDPRRQVAIVRRPDAPARTLSASDELAVEDLLPGWSVTVGELFG